MERKRRRVLITSCLTGARPLRDLLPFPGQSPTPPLYLKDPTHCSLRKTPFDMMPTTPDPILSSHHLFSSEYPQLHHHSTEPPSPTSVPSHNPFSLNKTKDTRREQDSTGPVTTAPEPELQVPEKPVKFEVKSWAETVEVVVARRRRLVMA